MKKIALLLLVLLIAAGAAGYFALQRLNEPFRGYEGSEQFVDIPSGASTRAIGDALLAKGIIRDEITYRLALWASGEARRLQAGEYRFDRPMTPRDVLGKIARGEVYTVAITFPEGLTIAEMSKIFEAHGFGAGGDVCNGVEECGGGPVVRSRMPAISKATCFPTPTMCRDEPMRRPWFI